MKILPLMLALILFLVEPLQAKPLLVDSRPSLSYGYRYNEGHVEGLVALANNWRDDYTVHVFLNGRRGHLVKEHLTPDKSFVEFDFKADGNENVLFVLLYDSNSTLVSAQHSEIKNYPTSYLPVFGVPLLSFFLGLAASLIPWIIHASWKLKAIKDILQKNIATLKSDPTKTRNTNLDNKALIDFVANQFAVPFVEANTRKQVEAYLDVARDWEATQSPSRQLQKRIADL